LRPIRSPSRWCAGGGVAYLVWLALQAFRAAGVAIAVDVRAGGIVRAWRDGVIVNLFNPKVAVFILAFVPQFVDPAGGSTALQFLILGMVLIAGGTVINGAVGLFAGSIGAALAADARITRVFRWVTGFVFLGLAAKLAIDRR
jgi:threonine/homoserine/homoserine lactone efflux protein